MARTPGELPRNLPDRMMRDALTQPDNLRALVREVAPDIADYLGSRKGPYGHDEAVLDDDDWPAVDRASPVLDHRFAEWLSKSALRGER